MSIFDKFKDKASELLEGATGKVSEATGIDLSGATDKIAESTGVDVGGVTDQATQYTDGLTDQATQYTDGLGETAQGHADAAGDHLAGTTGIDVPTEDLGTQATDKLGDITGR